MNLFKENQKLINFGYFCGLLSGLLWAVAGIYYEKLYNDFPELNAFALNIIILLIAETILLSLIAVYLIKRKSWPTFNRIALLGIASGLCGGPIGMLFYLQSLQSIGIGHTAAISILYPLIASILSIQFLGIQASKKTIFSFLLIVLLLIPIMYQDDNTALNTLGIIFALCCALCWAVEIVISSYAMRHYQANQAYLFRQIGSSLGYAVIIVFQVLSGNYLITPDFNVLKNTDLWQLEWMIILSSGLSYLLYYKAIAILNPIRAMALNITYSLWAVILSAIILSKEISTLLIIIGLIVLANVFVVAKGETK